MNWVSIGRISKIIALAAFFLPWMTVSCQGQSVATLSGVELATGVLSPETASKLPNSDGGGGQIQWLVLVAALAGIAGLVFSWQRLTRDPARSAMIASAIAAGSVFLSPFVFEWSIEGALSAEGAGSDIGGVVSVDRQIGFWVALVGFVLATIAWRQYRRSSLLPGSNVSGSEPPTALGDEDAAWKEAAHHSSPVRLRDYLDRFPVGRYRDLAEEALKRLGGAPVGSHDAPDDLWRRGRLLQAGLSIEAVAPIVLFAASLAIIDSLFWVLNGQVLDLYGQRTGWSPELGADLQMEAWRQAIVWTSAAASLVGLLIAGICRTNLRAVSICTAGALVCAGTLLLPGLPGVASLFLAPLCLQTAIAILWCLGLYAVAEKHELPDLILWFGGFVSGQALFSFVLDNWLRDGWDPEESSSTQGAVSLLGVEVVYLVLCIALAAMLAAIIAVWKPVSTQHQESRSEASSPRAQTHGSRSSLLADPGSVHMLAGMFAIALFLPVLWQQVWSGVFAARHELSDSELINQPIVQWIRLAPAIGLLAGGFLVASLSRQNPAWRAVTPAVALALAPVAILASLNTPNSILNAVLPLALAYFPTAAVYGHLAGLGNTRSRFGASLASTFVLLVPAALTSEASQLVAFAAGGLSESVSNARALRPFAGLMAVSLVLLWPALHFLAAARAIGYPYSRQRAPVLTYVVLGAVVLAGSGFLAWKHIPEVQGALRQLVENVAPRELSSAAPSDQDTATTAPNAATETRPVPIAEHTEPESGTPAADPLDAITIRAGESLGRFKMDTDCRLLFDSIELSSLASRSTGPDGTTQVCEYNSLIAASPSGDWAVTFGATNDYGYDYVGIVSQRDNRVVRKPAVFPDPEGPFVPGSRRSERYPHQGLRPLDTWTSDEQFLLLAKRYWNGIPCVLNVGSAAIACPSDIAIERAVISALRTVGAECPPDSTSCGARWDPGPGEMVFGDAASTTMQIPVSRWLAEERVFELSALGGFIADDQSDYGAPVTGYELAIQIRPDGALVGVSARGPIFRGLAPSGNADMPVPAEPAAPPAAPVASPAEAP
ncbi:MAG: hypothetical protein ABMA14_02865 [Hyphomonadaceae bacterium]